MSRKSISPLASTLPSHLYTPSSLLLMLRICKLLFASTANRSVKQAKERRRHQLLRQSPENSEFLRVKLQHFSVHPPTFHQPKIPNLKVKCNFTTSSFSLYLCLVMSPPGNTSETLYPHKMVRLLFYSRCSECRDGTQKTMQGV